MTQSAAPVADVATGRVADLARRIGCTDGQLYTMAIGLSVAILLLAFGLPGTFGGATRPAAGDEPAASVTPPPTSPPSTPPASSAPTPPPSSPPSVAPVPSGQPSPGVGTAGPAPVGTPAPAPSGLPDGSPNAPPPGDSSEPTPDEPCPATEGAQPVVDALAATGVFPDQSTTLILARITGCSETDPTVLLLGALAELGSGLPDLGFDIPPLPLPFIEIPPTVVEAIQPLRDAIDPMCDAVGQVSQVIIYGFGTWPGGVGPALGTPIRQLLLACGQLRPA